MKRKFGIYVIVSMLVFLSLVGCNQQDVTQSDNEPVKDSIVIGIAGDMPTFDPHNTATGFDLLSNIYDTLIRKNQEGEFIPSLAKEWSISEDGLNYTFKLVEGVKFHNGEELKASDVVFSINRAKGSQFLAAQTAFIEDVVADDDYTVTISLVAPDATFLSVVESYLNIVNEKAVTESGEDYGINPIGTGPYKFVSHSIGQKIILERFDDYFNGPSDIKDVEYKIISDQTTAVIALETGEIDFLTMIPKSSIQAIIDNENLYLYEVETLNIFYLLMNHNNEPFNNVLVRKAINYAIDKEKMIQIVEEGLGKEAKVILNKSIFGYSEKVKGYDYNPEKAKQLLIDAGFEDGFEITLKGISGIFGKLVQVIQEDLSEIGITAKIELMEQNSYIQDAMSGNYDIGVLGITLGSDADFYSMMFHTNHINDFNISNYSNTAVDELFNQGKASLNRDERLKLYEQLFQTLEDDAVIVPLYYPTRILAGNKDLVVGYISPLGLFRIEEMSWKK